MIRLKIRDSADMEAAAREEKKRQEQEELPTMSATSYPGQEWNPYGEFAFDEDD